VLTSKVVLKEVNVSFGMYVFGYVILIVGLAIGAHLLHVPPKWITVGVICMMGIGILSGVTNTRHRDPPTQ
jgi:ABC-type polysaccharide/polyol phosphate export permease